MDSQFTCAGCNAVKVPDGTPRNRPFIWTMPASKRKITYCYECDDKLIQDLSLPRDEMKIDNQSYQNDSLCKSQEEMKKMLTDEKLL